jgi:tetrahydromethanopterin S-methyltransferase subunit D
MKFLNGLIMGILGAIAVGAVYNAMQEVTQEEHK